MATIMSIFPRKAGHCSLLILKETEIFVRMKGTLEYRIYLSIGDYIFCSGSKATELNVYYVLLLMKVGLHARPIVFTHRHFLL